MATSTLLEHSIGATARDYSTIGSWESASPVTGSSATGQDYDAANELVIGVLYDDADFTEQINIAGATGDPQSGRGMRPAVGQEYDHVTDTGLLVHGSTGYGTHICSESWFRWGFPGRPMCLKGRTISDTRGGQIAVSSPYGQRYDSIIWRKCWGGRQSYAPGSTSNSMIHMDYDASSQPTVFRNCMGMDIYGKAVRDDGYGGCHYINCTWVDTDGVNGNFRTPYSRYINCVSMDAPAVHGNADWQLTAAGSSDYNASSDTTAPGGNSLISQTSSDWFVDPTPTSFDLHLLASANGVDAGDFATGRSTHMDHEGTLYFDPGSTGEQTISVEDGSPGYTDTFTGGPNENSTYGTEQKWAATGSGESATFTFTVTAGNYLVLSMWTIHSNRGTNCHYEVFDDASSFGTFDSNQEMPMGQYQDSDADGLGRLWDIIGEQIFNVTSTTLKVVMTPGNEYIISDAIRIIQWDGPLPTAKDMGALQYVAEGATMGPLCYHHRRRMAVA